MFMGSVTLLRSRLQRILNAQWPRHEQSGWAPRPPVSIVRSDACAILEGNDEVSHRSRPPVAFDFALARPAGSGWLYRLVRRWHQGTSRQGKYRSPQTRAAGQNQESEHNPANHTTESSHKKPTTPGPPPRRYPVTSKSNA